MVQPYPIPRQSRQTDVLVGDGVTATFGPFAFKIFDVDDVEVWTEAVDGAGFVLTAPLVTKQANLPFDNFTVTFPSPVPSTTKLVVRSARVAERSAGVDDGTRLSMTALEKELSKQATVLQELRRDIDRAVLADFGDDPLTISGALNDGDFLMKGGDGIIKGGSQSDVGLVQDNLGWTQFAVPIGGTGIGQVSSNMRDRFKHMANAVTDFGFSVFDGAAVKDNGPSLQTAIDKLQNYEGALFIPPIEGGSSSVYEISPVTLRDTSNGGGIGKSVGIFGLGGGEKTFGLRNGVGGHFEVGNGLKLRSGSNNHMITSPPRSGHLYMENLVLDVNSAGQSDRYRGIYLPDNTSGLYGFAVQLKDVAILSAGKAGLYVGGNRGMGRLHNVGIMYCGQPGAVEAAFELKSYDWMIIEPQFGQNNGPCMRALGGAQIQIYGGAMWQSEYGLLINNTCRDIVLFGTHFDSHKFNGVVSTGWTGAGVGSRRFISCGFVSNSQNGNNISSDFQWIGQDVVLIGCNFLGDANVTGKTVKYNLEALDASSKAHVVAPIFTAASYATAYCSAPMQLSAGGPTNFIGVRPVVTGSRAGNAALASLLTQLQASGYLTDSTTA